MLGSSPSFFIPTCPGTSLSRKRVTDHQIGQRNFFFTLAPNVMPGPDWISGHYYPLGIFIRGRAHFCKAKIGTYKTLDHSLYTNVARPGNC